MQPEQQITTEPIYDGQIVRLRRDTVSLPDGGQTTREVVDHNNAVALVPIDGEGNVLLVRQFRYAVGQALLEVPAGLVEDNESPDECAQRELQEETGFYARYLRPLGGFWTSPGFCTEYLYAYLASDLVSGPLTPDEDENISVERLPLSRIPSLIRLGEIQDAKSIAVLLMATYLFDAK